MQKEVTALVLAKEAIDLNNSVWFKEKMLRLLTTYQSICPDCECHPVSGNWVACYGYDKKEKEERDADDIQFYLTVSIINPSETCHN